MAANQGTRAIDRNAGGGCVSLPPSARVIQPIVEDLDSLGLRWGYGNSLPNSPSYSTTVIQAMKDRGEVPWRGAIG